MSTVDGLTPKPAVTRPQGCPYGSVLASVPTGAGAFSLALGPPAAVCHADSAWAVRRAAPPHGPSPGERGSPLDSLRYDLGLGPFPARKGASMSTFIIGIVIAVVVGAVLGVLGCIVWRWWWWGRWQNMPAEVVRRRMLRR